ncbi:MAG: hypothetical protein ABSH35_20665 [Isosphaeraceae bacterium]
MDVYRDRKNRPVAIGQRDASSPGAFIVINGDGLRVFLFGARVLNRTDQNLRAVARAYRITSSLEVFLSSYILVFAHLVAPPEAFYSQDDTRY